MKLVFPVDFKKYLGIRPVCLPMDDQMDYSGRSATVTGWGTTSSGGKTSTVLRGVDVTVLSNNDCRTKYSYPSSWITDQMLCANAPEKEGGKDACQGDSGGPLTISSSSSHSNQEQFDLIGVVSWGIGCGHPKYPGVYARVSKQLRWIRNVTVGSWETCSRN